jgi:omega-hydroxy-beta-dihydromenaquinone-9 sulfotransferase
VNRPDPKIRAPILIVGVGRSGTTLLYDLLARHPDVAWFSNLTDRFPSAPRLAGLSDLYRRSKARRLGGRWIPTPAEGYRLWRHPRSDDDGPLGAADATPPQIAYVNRIVASHLRYQHKGRFLNKNTRNTRCLPYLDSLFDGALFVHVMRDPRAVVASLLRVAFWPEMRIWSAGGITPRRWADEGRDPAELAAGLWAADVRRSRADGATMPPDRYLEVRYEELVADPGGVLRRITDFVRLEPLMLSSYLAGVTLEDRNEKFRDQMGAEQLRLVERTVEEVALGCGYQFGVEPTRPALRDPAG